MSIGSPASGCKTRYRKTVHSVVDYTSTSCVYRILRQTVQLKASSRLASTIKRPGSSRRGQGRLVVPRAPIEGVPSRARPIVMMARERSVVQDQEADMCPPLLANLLASTAACSSQQVMASYRYDA